MAKKYSIGLPVKVPGITLKQPLNFYLPVILYFSLLFVILLLTSCTSKKITDPMESKMKILEERVVSLERHKYKTASDLQDESTKFQQRILKEIENFRKSQRFFISELEKLRDDFKLNTNDMELIQHEIRLQKIRLGKLQKRLGDQIIALDQLQKFFRESIDLTSKSTSQDQKIFKKALQTYRKKQFKKAKQEFSDFLAKYPKSKLVDDSLFFIAYLHFLQGEYDSASLRFFELLKQYPKSNRLNEAKWWLGVALERSGDPNGACDRYKELVKLDGQNPLRIKAEFRVEELSCQVTAKP